MSVKPFNDDTLKALGEQGGIAEVKKDEPEVKEDPKVDPEETPDVILDIKEGDPKGDPEVKEDLKEDPEDPKKDPEVDPLVDSGIDITAMQDRVIKEGFTDEIIAELKEKIDPDLVDKQVASYKSQLAEAKKKQESEFTAQEKATVDMNTYIYDSVGGEDKFKAMGAILVDKLDKSAQDVINTKLQSGNKIIVNEGLKEAVTAYEKVTGRGDTRMSGEPNGDTTPEFTFYTKRDYQAAMRTEKYKTDKIYAAKVDKDRIASRKADNAKTLPGMYFKHGAEGLYEV